MKWVIVLGLVARVADAAPDIPSATWADWVGSYRGTLAWRDCAIAGSASAILALDAADGVLSIDLAPARPGLRAMSLVAEDGAWSAQQGDVKLKITRRADRLELVVELDSGCRMTARLQRASTGVASCDRLVAWSRVESRCTKLRDAPLEDAGKVAGTKWRVADANSCAARAAKLEASLVDVGCAPYPDPLIGVRARECLELASESAKLSRCGNVPADLKDAVVFDAGALASAAQSADRATLPYVERQCRDAKATIVALATRFGCP